MCASRSAAERPDLRFELGDAVGLAGWSASRLAEHAPDEPVEASAVGGGVAPDADLDLALAGAVAMVPLGEQLARQLYVCCGRFFLACRFRHSKIMVHSLSVFRYFRHRRAGGSGGWGWLLLEGFGHLVDGPERRPGCSHLCSGRRWRPLRPSAAPPPWGARWPRPRRPRPASRAVGLLGRRARALGRGRRLR